MQAQRYTSNPWRKYDGLLRSFQVIWKEEGIYGLYRGTLAAMLGALGKYTCLLVHLCLLISRSHGSVSYL